ncbi:ribonuclease P protein component [Pleionea sediminis]|uniref:ribonuclease P protein component n=1 Tax=Pleionea sediminis TaxID=2569479 RepID=UPI001187050B|nr:ribonuclease P protein component [Pleionea sediminis]
MVSSNSDSLSFSRELRLLKASDFSFVFDKPVRIGNRAFTVLSRANLSSSPRLGLAIAKKQVKLAVDRNLIKRKIRESFRTNQHNLPNCDFVVMVKRAINDMSRAEIDSALQHVWRKARKLCENC